MISTLGCTTWPPLEGPGGGGAVVLFAVIFDGGALFADVLLGIFLSPVPGGGGPGLLTGGFTTAGFTGALKPESKFF